MNQELPGPLPGHSTMSYEEWQNNPHFYSPTKPYTRCATCGYGPGAYFHNEYHVQKVSQSKAPSFDLRDSAGVLFGVFPERVTRELVKKVRVVFYLLSSKGFEVGVWPDCPTCKQSATGRYWMGFAGCTRCGWSEGGAKNRRDIL